MSALVWSYLVMALCLGYFVGHKLTKWACHRRFTHLIKKYGLRAADHL